MFNFITTPFSWLLLWLYHIVGNYGVAIILFALVVKLILLPFQMKSKRGTIQTTRLTPRLKELEKRYEGNKQKYQEEVSKIYKEEHINPLSGCLWSLIPFPILIALYNVIIKPMSMLMSLSQDQITLVKDTLTSLGVTLAESSRYSEIDVAQQVFLHFDKVKEVVPQVVKIDFSFIGLNLSSIPNWKFFLSVTDWSFSAVWPMLGLFIIPVLSAGLALISSLLSTKMQAAAASAATENSTMKTMLYMMPLISLYIGFVAPAGLGVYWTSSTLFSMLQDIWLTKRYNKIFDKLDAERLARVKLLEEDREKKRLETERLKEQNATARNPNTSKRKVQKVEKQKETERAAAIEREKKNLPPPEPSESRIGERPYARGRAFASDRFSGGPDLPEPAAEETAALSAPERAAPVPEEDAYGDAAPWEETEAETADDVDYGAGAGDGDDA